MLDAIRFLKRLLKGTENAFLATTRTRWLDISKQVFETEAVLDGVDYVYRVENVFEVDSPVSKVNFESLKASGETVFQQFNGTIHLFGMGPEAPSVLPWKTTNPRFIWRASATVMTTGSWAGLSRSIVSTLTHIPTRWMIPPKERIFSPRTSWRILPIGIGT